MKKIGRYEIVEEVGRGAMGVVYKAQDPTIGRLVAIKVLSLDPNDIEDKSADPQEIFMREARAAGRLSHPGIVTIHDALEDPEAKNNYIVMEFIPGRTLEKVLISDPPLPVEKSLEIIRQVAEALDYAHKQNIIHRDLKPANILLTEDGRAKITDFGIAKILAREGAKRTAAIMGTPSYMSPEQLTGGEIDARSDVFSLGVLAYIMLTGEKPFPGDTAAVMFKIVYEDPVPPSELKPVLTQNHDYLLLRSLIKDRKKRYASAREFLDDLEDIQQGRPPRSEAKFPMSELRAGERTLYTRGVPLPFNKQKPALGRKGMESLGMIAAATALVLILGSGVLIYRSFRPKPPSTPAPQTVQTPPTAGSMTSPAVESKTSPSSSDVTPKKTEGKEEAAKGASSSATAKSHSSKKSPGETGASSLTSAKTQKTTPPGSPTTQPVTTPQKTVAESSSPAKPTEAQPPQGVATATKTPATLAATGARSIQLSCKFELKNAVLTVSGDSGVIFQGKLEGKKKSGFLHLNIKGGYGGTFARPLTLPGGTKNISVHVLSEEESVDLTRKIAVAPAAAATPTLQVSVNDEKLTLRWNTPGQK